MGIVFSRRVIFSPCTISLPSLLGPKLLCPLGPQRDQETCPEVTGQDSKRRSCHIMPGRAGCFSREQVAPAKHCPGGGCEPGHKELSEVLISFQPNTGGEREAGGEGGAGEGL